MSKTGKVLLILALLSLCDITAALVIGTLLCRLGYWGLHCTLITAGTVVWLLLLAVWALIMGMSSLCGDRPGS